MLPALEHRLPHLTRHTLDDVATELDGRSRETLHWHTPAEALDELLVATTA